MQELKPGLLYCTEPPEKTWAIQVWTKPNPLWLYSGSNEYIQGIRPEELWTEVFNIVQEAVIPKKKKCRNPKWLCDKASQIAEKRREVKGKGERERWIQLNAEFQKIARRDKKTFLNKHCKEIEENNRIGRLKIRDLVNKIGDIDRAFYARMGTIKDRNGKELMEAEEIKKSCQEYTDKWKILSCVWLLVTPWTV